MNSTVTYVSQLDAHWNPLWAIRPYYDYQAQLRNSSTNGSFWTDPYMDFDGLGEVATVAHPGSQIPTLDLNSINIAGCIAKETGYN